MIHVKVDRQLEKPLKASSINLLPFFVLTKKDTERERVSHLRVMHLHVGAQFPGRRLWLERSETIDHIVSLRSIGHDSLPVQKVAPLDDDLRNALVAREGPIME